MKISLIAAVADNGVIGASGALPWHLSADLKRFKAVTMGHHLLVGRKTWESIGRPLPGRHLVVISRRKDYRPEGVEVASSLAEALARAESAGDDEAFVGGGAEIYRQALPQAHRLYLTRVHLRPEGDTYFPLDLASEGSIPGRRVHREEHGADETTPFAWTFEIYELFRGGDPR